MKNETETNEWKRQIYSHSTTFAQKYFNSFRYPASTLKMVKSNDDGGTEVKGEL